MEGAECCVAAKGKPRRAFAEPTGFPGPGSSRRRRSGAAADDTAATCSMASQQRKTPPCSNHNDGVPAPCVSERGAKLKVGAEFAQPPNAAPNTRNKFLSSATSGRGAVVA
jgi:hypothetical protein